MKMLNTLRLLSLLTVSTLPGFARAAPLCTTTGCDNKDPASYGCTADAQILRTAYIANGATYLARIDGMYSQSCGAQWTRVTNWSSSPATLQASQYSNGTQYASRWYNNVQYNYYINSYMMSATYFLQAYGEWGSGFYNFTTAY